MCFNTTTDSRLNVVVLNRSILRDSIKNLTFWAVTTMFLYSVFDVLLKANHIEVEE